MSNPRPNGKRDGDFVVFKGWDIPAYDIAYYPKFSGRIDDLKKTALSNPGALITAFTSTGWMKTCPAHDYSKWVANANVDMYVRVNYPGWYFVQGVDSPGNNLDPTPLGTNVAALMVNTIFNFPEEKSARVAGFNTSGWVKTKINSDLRGSSDDPLEGIYIRTEFPGYEFFQGADSKGNDITRYPTDADNIPPLFGASDAYSSSMGFNTTGWIKTLIKVPPPDHPSELQKPRRGTYVRTRWPGYTFLPMLDSPGNDRRRDNPEKIWKLVDRANNDDNIVAFNTSGWMKSELADFPVDFNDQSYDLGGLYVKEPNLDANIEITNDDLEQCLFILRATAMIWGKWLLTDLSNIRAQYNRLISYGTLDIQRRTMMDGLPLKDAAREALTMRNQYLSDMRKITYPLDRMVAVAIKPDGRPIIDILNSYAKKRFGGDRTYDSLTQEQAVLVMGDAIDASGRANEGTASIMQGVGYVSKVLIAIGAAVSMYQVVTANEWKDEIGSQLVTWSGEIVNGQLGDGVTTLVGPVGAIIGGVVGGMIGALGGPDMKALAHWFFGGRSGLAAEELFGPSLLAAAQLAVREQLRRSGQNFYVHRVLATHVSGDRNAQFNAANIAEDMITTKSETSVGVEVVATVVWVVTDGTEDPPPLNLGNPANLIALMQWAARNLPS